MKLLALFALLLVFSFSVLSQDYSSYYKLVNEAEEQFVLKRDNTCFALYDEAFASNKPFIKDPYIASQIAFYLGDTNRFYGYLRICFSNGMPVTAVDASPMLRTKLKPYSRIKISQIAKLHYKATEPDSTLYANICMCCYQSDSIKMVMNRDPIKIQRFYASENAARIYILDSLLRKGIYANEHLIPISSLEETKKFYKTYNRPDPYQQFPSSSDKSVYELRAICPFNILLHSHCFFQEHRELFFEMVKKGYLHPKEYGIMEETSIVWYEKDNNSGEQCSQPQVKTCYNILGLDAMRSNNCYTSTKEGLETVEINRKAIYMQSFAIDEAKKRLEKDLGIVFFFDFIDRQ